MKTRYLGLAVFLMCAGLVAAMSGQALAAVGGECVNCHTMHNSQNGAKMTGNDGPNNTLLRDTCLGCHTSLTDTPCDGPGCDAADSPVGAPSVNTVGGSTAILAGGTFYYTDDGVDSSAMGHNVDWLSGEDANLDLQPPGYQNQYQGDVRDAGDGDDTWAIQLRCAGTYGCHGKRDVDDAFGAVKGAHHTNVAGTVTEATTVGTSFRFLNGIKGVEDDDYQINPGAGHNYYQGADNDDDNAGTISYLCATCHGLFHDRDTVSTNSPAASPWIRHPTDIKMPQDASKEYKNYDTVNDYNDKAPVAWIDPTDTDDKADAVVMCLSCHRAHGAGSDDDGYKDILRFDYTGTQIAGAGDGSGDEAGCLTCHNTKDATP